MGWGTLGVVRDGARDPREGPERVGGISVRFGTGRGTHKEVWDVVQDSSGDTWGGQGRVRAISGRSGTGQGTLGSEDPSGGPGRVVYPLGFSGRVGGISMRSGTDRINLEEV